MKSTEYATLPVRATFLVFLFGMAYYLGYGTPQEAWRKASRENGIEARYTRNGRLWRTFCDRNQNGTWDMWIDERAGHPYIVSTDEDGDGMPDRDLDETGKPLSAWSASQLRSYKTVVEFLHNRRQLAYFGLAILLYSALEFTIRVLIFK